MKNWRKKQNEAESEIHHYRYPPNGNPLLDGPEWRERIRKYVNMTASHPVQAIQTTDFTNKFSPASTRQALCKSEDEYPDHIVIGVPLLGAKKAALPRPEVVAESVGPDCPCDPSIR